ncbi:histone-like nucleoid-structuring protein Lsr2 [Tsukamurella spumae]|uniref:Lsr2 family protein n=1 Tax=Tsukamurella spumae TaxID=44753 RepID=A0A846X165_9ACTN|nr:Lsr2 family protein [Tsukamurella spumae]NKY18851.1 Lsr2 family protein [Tsukamurella spumae]
MAKKIIQVVEYVDDLDGSPLEEGQVQTVQFGWGGASYEIDLSKKNADKLEALIKPYVGSARRTSRGRGGTVASKRPGTGSGRSKDELLAIREWLRANGHEVSDRGRIPQTLLDAYDDAH